MIKRIAAITGVVVACGATAFVAVAIWPERTAESGSTSTTASQPAPRIGTSPGSVTTAPSESGLASPVEPSAGTLVSPDTRFLLRPAAEPPPVQYRFKHPPAAGILFDVKSGEVLWQRRPRLEHPIASLTKMMTALIVARRNSLEERVKVSAKAAHTPGSATGLLPRGRKVPLGPLLQALVLISANDAAVALAEHDGGTVTRFIKLMNRQARAMGLTCTHFSTPNGLRDRNNYSCGRDLAALARADLANPRLARIARTRYAKPRFPIKGKRLHLSNNHYFLQRGLAGVPQAEVTGLKTGFTDAAGRCYVTTARVGRHHLGVVILDSPNPLSQVPALLRAGFVEEGVVPPPPPAPPRKRPPTG
jgi:serine-type D-Ala-D-Ala carboxypeptidase (penicillin-binding protein 5/6)